MLKSHCVKDPEENYSPSQSIPEDRCQEVVAVVNESDSS